MIDVPFRPNLPVPFFSLVFFSKWYTICQYWPLILAERGRKVTIQPGPLCASRSLIKLMAPTITNRRHARHGKPVVHVIVTAFPSTVASGALVPAGLRAR